jgi:hypothetical protein
MVISFLAISRVSFELKTNASEIITGLIITADVICR